MQESKPLPASSVDGAPLMPGAHYTAPVSSGGPPRPRMKLAVLDPDWIEQQAQYPFHVTVTGVPSTDAIMHDHEEIQTQTVTHEDGRWTVTDGWGGEIELACPEDVGRFLASFFCTVNLVERRNPEDEEISREERDRCVRDELIREIGRSGVEPVSIKCSYCGSLFGWRPSGTGPGTVGTCSKSCARNARRLVKGEMIRTRKSRAPGARPSGPSEPMPPMPSMPDPDES